MRIRKNSAQLTRASQISNCTRIILESCYNADADLDVQVELDVLRHYAASQCNQLCKFLYVVRHIMKLHKRETKISIQWSCQPSKRRKDFLVANVSLA